MARTVTLCHASLNISSHVESLKFSTVRLEKTEFYHQQKFQKQVVTTPIRADLYAQGVTASTRLWGFGKPVSKSHVEAMWMAKPKKTNDEPCARTKSKKGKCGVPRTSASTVEETYSWQPEALT